jgi:putative methyltransferase (TIGR04325 family)
MSSFQLTHLSMGAAGGAPCPRSLQAGELHAPGLQQGDLHATGLQEGWDKPCLADYPAMFWLRDGLDHGLRSVFDLGGHVGVKFYAFESWLRCPAETRWTVCEVPELVERGRRLAAARMCEDMLDFTEQPGDADGYDMLFASGSLQLLPWTLHQQLALLKQLPRRLVINATAIHPDRSYFVPRHSGPQPLRVQAEREFVAPLERLGYRQLDRWETPAELAVPPQDRCGLDHFTGYCFDRW